MKTLRDFAKYLRESRLKDYVLYYLAVLRETDIPLIKLAIEKGLVKDLSDETLLATSMERQAQSLLWLEDGTVVAKAKESLKLWEEDKLPGISKGDILPADLVLIYAVQKKALFHFLPEFTRDIEESMAIVQEGEDLYADMQSAAAQMLFKIQKNTEEQLRKSEEQFRLLVQNVRDYAIFMLDPKGYILNWNEGIEKIKGYSANEIIGKHISIFYTDEDNENGVPEHNLMMAEKMGHYESEGVRVRKDGSRFWADVTYTAIYDEKRNLTGFSKVTRDITKRKNALNELETVNHFLDLVLENIPNMIFVKEPNELRFVRLNRGGEKLLGYSKEELLGKNTYDFFPKEQSDFFTAKDREVLNQTGVIDIPEEPIDTKTGQRWLHTKKIPILDPVGKPLYLLGISEDITDIRQDKIELEKKTKELERSNAELEQFAYVASHDLQEPLRTISSYMQLLAERYKNKLDKDADEFIDFAVDGSNRMRLLINSLLEYSRVNKVRPLEWIDPAITIKEILLDMQDQVKESDATVIFNDLPEIYGDRVLIGQLFQNLISNAIKFRDDKKPEIKISGKKEKAGYLFCVKDNGIGLKTEYADKIFVIFQRLNSREKYPGAGIGLSICKKIVERHGGTIWVESEPGKGAAFYFTIKTTLAE